MGRLSGKVVFITGIAGGQGRAAAEIFAQEGARIFGCDIKDAEAEETVEMVRRAGGEMESSIVDLTDPDATAAWIERGIAWAGRVDVLYNNAGNPRMNFVEELSREDWSYTIASELDTLYNTIKPTWQHMVDQGRGAIINVASIAAHSGYGNVGAMAHCAAKGGVLALTRQLAAEGAPVRIRVNSISPGTILTPALGVLTEEQLAQLDSMQPLGRAGRASDIAYCALYLASDEAEWVTGSDFIIDGGVTSMLGARS